MLKSQKIMFFVSMSCFIFSACEGAEVEVNQHVSQDSSDNQSVIDLISDEEVALDVLAKEYLGYLSKFDFVSLQELNGDQKVLFSPYLYVDTSSAKLLTFKEIADLADNNKLLNWGEYDGTGDPIHLSARKYVERFVIDVDYLNDSVEVNIGEVQARGNSLSNLQAIFPSAEFVEFYRGPQDEEMAGMDWRSLILVFEEIQNEMILIAIVHNEWTS